jgi:hypothetical protein
MSKEQFLEFSAVLTGFSRLDLLGTGMLDLYYGALTEIVGGSICGELWADFEKLMQKCGGALGEVEAAVEKHILPDQKLGPVAKTIVQMWYLGQWSQLPPEWREKYGTNPSDFNHVISPASYVEGLVWRAAGVHPQGAKQPGFGTWSAPPVQIAAPETGKAAMAAEED